MTFDYQSLLIAAVFVSQIFVLSFYAPTSWQRYHSLLFKRYPQEEYPRLHPLPLEELERKFAIFRPMHLVIGVGAILTFLGAVTWAENAQGFAGLMQMCLFVQLLPLYIALPLAIRMREGLKAMPPPSARSTELKRWRVTDFVSPVWVVLAIAAQVLGLACALAIYLYRPGTMGIFVGCINSGLMLVALTAPLFGFGCTPREDPYMSRADTFQARQRIFRGLYVISAALSTWGTFTLLFNAGLIQFDLTFQFVSFSIIAQLLAIGAVATQNSDLNTRDFSVYRADGGASVAQ